MMETTIEEKTKKEPVLWYVLRAIFGKELEIKKKLDREGIENFIPMRYKIKASRGKKERLLVPVIHDLIFVHATKSFLENFKAKSEYILYFMTEKVDDRRKIIVVPDSQMVEFIRIARQVEEDILYFKPEEIRLEKGDKVRVHGGKFDGVEGVLLKVKGKRSKRVVVKISGVTAIAASYIEPELIEVISQNSSSTPIKEDTEALEEAAYRILFPPQEAGNVDWQNEANLLRNEIKHLFNKLVEKKGHTTLQEASICLALLCGMGALDEQEHREHVLARCQAVLPQLKDSLLKGQILSLLYKVNPEEERLAEIRTLLAAWSGEEETLSAKQEKTFRLIRAFCPDV